MFGTQDASHTNNYLEIQAANGTVRSTRETKVYIQELGTYLYEKFWEDSSSALSFGRLEETPH